MITTGPISPKKSTKELQFSNLLSPSDDLFKFNAFRVSPNHSPISSDLFASSPSMYESLNSQGNNPDQVKELKHRLANRDDECDHLRKENEKLRHSVAAHRAEAQEVETQSSVQLQELRESYQRQAQELRSECELFKVALGKIESKKSPRKSPVKKSRVNTPIKDFIRESTRPQIVELLLKNLNTWNAEELRGEVRNAMSKLDAWERNVSKKEQKLSHAEAELKAKSAKLNAKIARVNKSVEKFNARKSKNYENQNNSDFNINPLSPLE